MAIMREKHSALMRPVVFALDHVRSITAATAETPHETWFQETYGEAIHNALERLRNPQNPANPANSWVPFKQVRTFPLVLQYSCSFLSSFMFFYFFFFLFLFFIPTEICFGMCK